MIETPQVIGYKIWELDEDWNIYSCTGGVREDEPASCYYKLPEEHEPPELKCSCGYYYTSSQDKLIEYWSGNFRDKAAFELALYGKIIECEYGGRAQYFKVLRVFLTEKMLAGMISPSKYPYVVLEAPPKKKLKAMSASDWVKHYQQQGVK